MEILKNTSLLTAVYIFGAILVVFVGAWREHVYRGNDETQKALINTKNNEILELMRTNLELQQSQGRDIKSLVSIVEDMRKEGKLSEQTADYVLKVHSVKIGTKIGNITLQESTPSDKKTEEKDN